MPTSDLSGCADLGENACKYIPFKIGACGQQQISNLCDYFQVQTVTKQNFLWSKISLVTIYID